MTALRRRWVVAIALQLLLQVNFISSKRDPAVFCSVCRALVDEITVKVNAADPKKKIQLGSYRVDPKGNQRITEVKYATSDVHLTEILEDVCQAFNDYAMTKDHISKRNGVVRTKTRDGQELDISNVQYSEKLRETFKSYCEEVLEENEDEIMALFKQDDLGSIESQICGEELSGACTEAELAVPVPKLQPKRKRPKFNPDLYELAPDGSYRAKDEMESIEEMKMKMEAERKKERYDALTSRRKLEKEDLDGDGFKDEL